MAATKTRRRMRRRAGFRLPKRKRKAQLQAAPEIPTVLETPPEAVPEAAPYCRPEEPPTEIDPPELLPPIPAPEPPPPTPEPEPPPPPLTHKITIPQVVYDVLVQQGLPLDTPYHPLYNVVGVSPQTSEQALECICFGKDWPSEMGGLGAFGHLKRFIDQTWPGTEWNDWLERMMRSLCDSEYETRIGNTRVRYVNWVGAGAAGKTFAAGLLACSWFIYDLACGRGPRSSVTLTSTSKGIIAQRVWPVIQKLYREAKFTDSEQQLKWGHMIDSMKQVQFRKGDAKHSICAMAVEPGELQGSLDKIKGRHTERMLLIVDEANSTPQAIFECIPNMLTAARELIVLVIGNAGSRLDPHGRCCEPKAGWKSITIEAEQWETRGVPQWGIGPGVCLHFDGQKSPNVLAGKTVHKHIYSFERWQQVLRMGDEYRNTLQHWSQDRGFWPPDGISTTIFSEAMVISHDGMGKFDWISTPEPYGGLDPAFGGDDCKLRFGLIGDIRGPKKAIQLTETLLVPFDPDSPDAIDFQIAKYTMAQCVKRGVKPEHFGSDATGIGRGVSAFLNQMWSPRVHAIEYAGKGSDLPASVEDPRPSFEVYYNRWTELWFIMREFLIAGQLRGLTAEDVKQGCSRSFEYVSRKYKIEPKSDMKLRLGYSPDDFDAAAVLVAVARMNGVEVQQMVTTPGGRQKPRGDWEDAQDDVASLAAGGYSETQTFDQYAA